MDQNYGRMEYLMYSYIGLFSKCLSPILLCFNITLQFDTVRVITANTLVEKENNGLHGVQESEMIALSHLHKDAPLCMVNRYSQDVDRVANE